LLGKDLARRARSRCELCSDSERKARLFDTDAKADPSLESVLLLCERCSDLIKRDCKGADPRELRFLEEVVWAEVPLVVATAKSLLKKVDEPWASDALDMVGE